MCLWGPSGVSVLSLRDVTKFWTATKVNIQLDEEPSCAYSGQWSISSFLFQRGFSLIFFLKFNEDGVVLRVLKIWLEVRCLKVSLIIIIIFFLKSFKDSVVFLEASVLFYEESLLISLEGFCFASILRKIFKFWMEIVFLGFTIVI